MKNTWSRKEISAITGIPDRRVLFYTEQLMLPGFNTATGRGTAREYSVSDLFYMLLIKELDSIGLSLVRIRTFIMHLHFMQMHGKQLFIDGRFTDEPMVAVISPFPKEHALSPTSKNYNEEFDVQWFPGLAGETEIKLSINKSSQIVINLNEIFKKAQL
jgi:DNA-binding transcriptional MerR regulator